MRSPKLTNSALAFLALQAINAICMFLQLLIKFDYDNIISSTVVAISTATLLLYLRSTRACEERATSSFALLGYCITTQFGALAGQTLAWTAITANLRQPVETFSILATLQLVAILAQITFRHFKGIHGISNSIAQRMWSPLGAFTFPSPKNLWILGAAGFLAQASSASETGNVIGKALDGFRFLAWAPFLIPVYYFQFGKDYCNQKKQFAAVSIYLMFAITLGMALNFRSVMFYGITTGALIFAMFVLKDTTQVARDITSKLLITGTTLGIFIFIMGDLATAMVLTRSQRGQATPMEMISNSLELFTQKEKLAAYRDSGEIANQVAMYDEKYMASPVVARFVETKFHDTCFYFGKALTDSSLASFTDTSLKQILTNLPEPVLRLFKINIQKDAIFFSSGDNLLYLTTGDPIGGFKTGSSLAQGIAIFENSFYAIYFFIVLILVVLFESLQLERRGAHPIIATTAMLMVFTLFAKGFVSESLANMFGNLRTVPQMVIFYAIAFRASQMVAKPYTPK
jgi:hypothetical protein